jgi:hypothetical protein
MERGHQPRQSRAVAVADRTRQLGEFLETVILPLTGLTVTLLLIAHYVDSDVLRQMFAL